MYKKKKKRLTVFSSIIIVLILLLANCEKDTNGIPVKYYENVTGEGYVFERYKDGTILPYALRVDFLKGNATIIVCAEEKQDNSDTDNYRHIDWVEVDKNGKYTCRFLEKKRPNVWVFGEWKKMSFYSIFTGYSNITYTSETIQAVAKKATKKNPQVIHIDTLWVDFNW